MIQSFNEFIVENYSNIDMSEFDNLTTSIFGNNAQIIDAFNKLIDETWNSEFTTRDDILNTWENVDDAIDDGTLLSAMEEMAETDDFYYNAYYNAFDVCRSKHPNDYEEKLIEYIYSYLALKLE